MERDAVEAVAGGADFLVDLKAALQRCTVVHAEWPIEGPAGLLGRQRARVDCSLRGRRSERQTKDESQPGEAHGDPHSAGALTCSTPEPVTEVAMVSGSGRGVSS